MVEVILHVSTVGDYFDDLQERAEKIEAGDRTVAIPRIGFATAEQLWTLLTWERWKLLETLRAKGPSTAEAIARSVRRDQREVEEDIGLLVDGGLIEKDLDAYFHVPWSKITAEMTFCDAA